MITKPITFTVTPAAKERCIIKVQNENETASADKRQPPPLVAASFSDVSTEISDYLSSIDPSTYPIAPVVALPRVVTTMATAAPVRVAPPQPAPTEAVPSPAAS